MAQKDVNVTFINNDKSQEFVIKRISLANNQKYKKVNIK